MTDYLVKRLSLNSKSRVLEIGCSDGSQLQFFKKFNMKVLGIDPASNATEIAKKRGIPVITGFFNYQLAKKLRNRGSRFDLIIGINLLNHIIKLKDFLKGIKLLLKPKGTAFFKFFMQRELDIITHEHVFYFSFLSLKNVFQNVGLEMYDAEINKGGVNIFVARKGVFPISKNVEYFINKELKKRI